ncbi:MAG: SLBB domain-containing protein [Magnetococcales bacterium]|nr:SLBB domain-containing protein [Magnetococcales bacterium]
MQATFHNSKRTLMSMISALFLVLSLTVSVSAFGQSLEELKSLGMVSQEQIDKMFNRSQGDAQTLIPLTAPQIVKPRGTKAAATANFSRVHHGGMAQFGYDIFSGAPSTFAPVTEVPIPASYILGPGDNVVFQLTGKESKKLVLQVGRDGIISFPDLGPIPVAGLTFADMKAQVSDMIKRHLIGMELAHVTMGQLRSVRIFILGDAYQPGSYTVSALSSMTNALMVSGGVNPVGSLRNIQLKRQGKVITRLDLYDLLLRGDTSGDARLQAGDTIFIPRIGKTVGVSGEVKRPAIYELKYEKSVQDVLSLAGGLLPSAYPKKTVLTRFSKGEEVIQIDIDLAKNSGKSFRVGNGDTLNIRSVPPEKKFVVTMTGSVKFPGSYQWHSGLRLTDLVPSIDDLQQNADLNYTLITRKNRHDKRIHVLTVKYSEALKDPSSPDNISLEPDDNVRFFRLDENKSSTMKSLLSRLKSQTHSSETAQIVLVSGMVRFPGAYPYVEGMGLRALIDAAAGVLPDADFGYTLMARTGKNGLLDPYSIDLTKTVFSKGDSGDIPLRPGDWIIIPNTLALPDTGVMESVFVNEPDVSTDLSTGLLPGAETLDASAVIQSGIIPNSGNSYPAMPQAVGADVPSNLQGAKSGVVQAEGANTANSSGVMPTSALQINTHSTISETVLGDETAPEDEFAPFKANKNIAALQVRRNAIIWPLLEILQSQTSLHHPLKITSISGMVRFPGSYPLEKDMTISQLIKAAGGLAEPAYELDMEITRYIVEKNMRGSEHITVNLQKILEGDAEHDILLKSKDVLHVKKLPGWNERYYVGVLGEVKFKGFYAVKKGETLIDLIKRAGGLTEYAYIDGFVFLRESLREREQEQLSRLSQRLEIELAYARSLAKEDDSRAVYGQVLSRFSEQLKRSTAHGRLAVDLREQMRLVEGDEEVTPILIREGDRIFIPEQINEVTVIGEINYSTSHQFDINMDVEDYINLSGGYGNNADPDSIYLVKANGQVRPRRSSSPFGLAWFHMHNSLDIQPGDTIVVPIKVDEVATMTFLKEISQILYNMSITAAAITSVGAL